MNGEIMNVDRREKKFEYPCYRALV